MTHIKTKSGFEADIDESRLDDYRLLRKLREAQKNKLAVVEVVSDILGDDQPLIDHLVAVTGKASVKDVEDELVEIFAQLGEDKKK